MDKIIHQKLMQIYALMYDHAGPRHWWPADTDFEVIIGAILTQFVSWKNVTTAIAHLKDENLLSIEALCGVDSCKLESLIRCTRFYKQKAKRLKSFCGYVKEHYEGSLELFFKKDRDCLRKELLSLYGIGEETADSIILYAARKPIFVVDAYTRRVYHRLGFFLEDEKYKDMQKFFMDHLEQDVTLFNEYHAQIDGVGGRYCHSKNPACKECPVQSVCNARDNFTRSPL